MEIIDGPPQSLVEVDHRLPIQEAACEGDVGTALRGIIRRERLVGDGGFGMGEMEDASSDLVDANLVGVADVDGHGII